MREEDKAQALRDNLLMYLRTWLDSIAAAWNSTKKIIGDPNMVISLYDMDDNQTFNSVADIPDGNGPIPGGYPFLSFVLLNEGGINNLKTVAEYQLDLYTQGMYLNRYIRSRLNVKMGLVSDRNEPIGYHDLLDYSSGEPVADGKLTLSANRELWIPHNDDPDPSIKRFRNNLIIEV